jgi:hypothetical protein
MEEKNKNPTASFTILLLNSSKIQNYIEKLVVGFQAMFPDFSGSQIAVVYMHIGFWILKQSEAVRNESCKDSHSQIYSDDSLSYLATDV